MDNFKVTIGGFKTKKQAKAFLDWYEGGGEQQFYDHLDILDMSADDGCNIDVRRGYDELDDGYYAEVK